MENLERKEHRAITEAADEARKIRRLQVLINMVMSVIGQDPNLTVRRSFRTSSRRPPRRPGHVP